MPHPMLAVLAKVALAAGNPLAGQMPIYIIDDGPGLSPEALRSFGVKRTTRVFESSSQARVSVGLGSVLMAAIANVHGGRLQITNDVSLRGAHLQIALPIE